MVTNYLFLQIIYFFQIMFIFVQNGIQIAPLCHTILLTHTCVHVKEIQKITTLFPAVQKKVHSGIL